MRTHWVLILSATGLTACSQQNWYQGAQSAQTAHCMKQPLADYEDCNQTSNESYNDFKNNQKQREDQNSTDR